MYAAVGHSHGHCRPIGLCLVCLACPTQCCAACKGLLHCSLPAQQRARSGQEPELCVLLQGWQARVVWISLGGCVFFTALEEAQKAFAAK